MSRKVISRFWNSSTAAWRTFTFPESVGCSDAMWQILHAPPGRMTVQSFRNRHGPAECLCTSGHKQKLRLSLRRFGGIRAMEFINDNSDVHVSDGTGNNLLRALRPYDLDLLLPLMEEWEGA